MGLGVDEEGDSVKQACSPWELTSLLWPQLPRLSNKNIGTEISRACLVFTAQKQVLVQSRAIP